MREYIHYHNNDDDADIEQTMNGDRKLRVLTSAKQITTTQRRYSPEAASASRTTQSYMVKVKPCIGCEGKREAQIVDHEA